MSLESGLFTLLSSVSGSAASTRVYPERAPDTPTYPLILYSIITKVGQDTRPPTSTDTAGSITGYSSGGGDDLDRVRVQVEFIGQTYEAVRALAGQVRPYVHGFNGTSGGEKFQPIYIETERDDPFESGAEVYRRIWDVIVWHKKS